MKKFICFKIFIIIYFSSLLYPQSFFDSRFGTNGLVLIDSLGIEGSWDISKQSDGRIIITGWRNKILNSPSDIAVLRFNPDGSFDSTFSSGVFIKRNDFSWEASYALAVQEDDKILVTGIAFENNSWDFLLLRLNSTGEIDSTFGTNGMVVTDLSIEDKSFTIDIQKDNKIIIAGLSTSQESDFAVLRFNSDGSRDSTFGNSGVVITDLQGSVDIIFSIKAQDDGKIIACGWTYGPQNVDFALVRYNNDGSLDSTFGKDGVVITDIYEDYNSAHSVDIQKDGKYIVAGYSLHPLKTDYDLILVRYNKNGSLDSTFGNRGIVTTDINRNNEFAWKVKVMQNSKIVVTGYIESEFEKKILTLKYNEDGSPDLSFGLDGVVITNIYGIDEEGRGLLIQEDKKILICGYADNGNDYDIFLLRLDNSLQNLSKSEPTLLQNYPNPCADRTTIAFQLPFTSFVSLKIYNILGSEVTTLINEPISNGYHEIKVELTGLASGIYFYQLKSYDLSENIPAHNFIITNKMVIVK